jgi:hypothetical protein
MTPGHEIANILLGKTKPTPIPAESDIVPTRKDKGKEKEAIKPKPPLPRVIYIRRE